MAVGDAVLARAGFRDDSCLAMRVASRICPMQLLILCEPVVVQLVPLEVDFCAAELFGEAFGEPERARAPT